MFHRSKDCPYQLHRSLARLLNRQRERSFQPRGSLSEDEEGLVRALGFACLLGRQGYFQGANVAQLDFGLDSDGRGKPISGKFKRQRSRSVVN